MEACVHDSAIVICIFIQLFFSSPSLALEGWILNTASLRPSIGNDFRLDLMPVAQGVKVRWR